MRITVLGLGYVGCVTAACLAEQSHDVVGVDADQSKVDDIIAGRSPIIEPGLEALIRAGLDSGRLSATVDLAPALSGAELVLVCVGTPSRPNGSLDLSHVLRVCEQLGPHLSVQGRVVVAIRSTILPGSIEEVVLPALEAASGGKAGLDFGLAMCPEFLRETTAISDFYDPPFTVVGSRDDWVHERLAEAFAFLPAPFHAVEIATAESLKYACNAWHATKVAFANEMARVCAGRSVDARQVMELFALDTQLNISPRYLRPGFAFGGSCLPKDVRALSYLSRSVDADTPLLASLLDSNARHVSRAVEMVLSSGARTVALFGLSFKAGTDDLRESPFVVLAETLIGKGVEVRIYDGSLDPARFVGANRTYMSAHLPHLASLLVADPAMAVDGAHAVIIGNADERAPSLLREASSLPDIIDVTGTLPRDVEEHLRVAGSFSGLAW